MSNTWNYVAAWVDYNADKIIVVERDQEGNRRRVKYDPPYYFYVEDPNGGHTSIFGDKLSKLEVSSYKEYNALKRKCEADRLRTFEKDIAPLKRVLMDNYYKRPTPLINYAFLDIEVDYNKEQGFSTTTSTYAPINAVTVWQSWTKKFYTAVVPPKGWNGDVSEIYAKIDQLIKDGNLRHGQRPEVIICKNELELVTHMLNWLNDADLISGWNSEFYDIPYICERLIKLGGETLLRRLDYMGVPKAPYKEMQVHFGAEEPTYKLSGKSHLDYKRAFQKFTFEGRTSYALGNILQEEVGVGKLDYDGTLEELYKNDFATFTAYNFRDVDGIVQLNDKYKFIALVNQMAHENTVVFEAIMGTVSYVETAITNHAHYELNLVVNDKKITEGERAEGAIVLTPNKGFWRWIGSVDIGGLYPNGIRSLNISPEMVVGQFTMKEKAWHAIKARSDEMLVLQLEKHDGSAAEEMMFSAKEWAEILVDNFWAVSGFGTVFDQSRGPGIIPQLLTYWLTERKRLQLEKKKWSKIVESLEGKVGDDNEELIHARKQEEYYDLLQLTKKISANSLYGALLNAAFRFGSESMGASTTGTGRQVTSFMIEHIAFLLTGEKFTLTKTTEFDKKGKVVNKYTIPPESMVIYGDTDSCYFRTGADNKETAIAIANEIANQVNAAFPQFMRDNFFCRTSNSTEDNYINFITANREIVGKSGLFLSAKKKYTIKVVDKEGRSTSELKSMGSEIKKADTPKAIQKFLAEMMDMILEECPDDEVVDFVIQERKRILGKSANLFQIGVAKQVNNLEKYLPAYQSKGGIYENGRKVTVPGHARAALNFNALVSELDRGTKPIVSGDKALIFYLKPNEYGFKSIALPAEWSNFPWWFNDRFKVDKALTEQKMFDSKLEGIFEALNKEIPSEQTRLIGSILEF